jgi:expansin (peptidoglycan-binding protein)
MARHLVLILSWAIPVAAHAACPPHFGAEGTATRYSDTGIGMCGFPPHAPGAMVAALNAPQWEGAAHCGECLEVSGPLGTVTVKVTNQCPGCAAGDLDLDDVAFAQIAPLSGGPVQISWNRVDCEVDGNLQTRVLQGGSAWFLILQADQHRHGIASAQARFDPEGEWRPLARSDSNAFTLATGHEERSADVRYLSTAGESIQHRIPDIAIPGSIDSGQQFPACVDETIFVDGFESAAGD